MCPKNTKHRFASKGFTVSIAYSTAPSVLRPSVQRRKNSPSKRGRHNIFVMYRLDKKRKIEKLHYGEINVDIK